MAVNEKLLSKVLKKNRADYTDKEWDAMYDADTLIRAEEIQQDGGARKELALVMVEVKKRDLADDIKAANKVK